MIGINIHVIMQIDREIMESIRSRMLISLRRLCTIAVILRRAAMLGWDLVYDMGTDMIHEYGTHVMCVPQ